MQLLADREHILRSIDAAPCNIADVQQAIDSAEIDKRAIGGKAAHRAADDVALFELGAAALFEGMRLLFGEHAPVHHHVLLADQYSSPERRH